MTLALIDGNAFYCSCERVFDPKVRKRPVIVLSNNDGCAVARTSEAKALGIKMGQPYFMIRDLCRREGVAVFSSNYTLYGDISARMNTVYRQFSPEVETYSIDESFLDLSGFGRRDLAALARDLRETVRKWVGIPTCVGLGSTKTLAKLANWIAKQVPELGGVCDLTEPAAYDHWLVRVPVEEVWGIGPASARKLQAMGVESAADLRDLDPRPVRQALGPASPDRCGRADRSRTARAAVSGARTASGATQGLRGHAHVQPPRREPGHLAGGRCRLRDPPGRETPTRGPGHRPCARLFP